jgi:hypothetical protein
LPASAQALGEDPRGQTQRAVQVKGMEVHIVNIGEPLVGWHVNTSDTRTEVKGLTDPVFGAMLTALPAHFRGAR